MSLSQLYSDEVLPDTEPLSPDSDSFSLSDYEAEKEAVLKSKLPHQPEWDPVFPPPKVAKHEWNESLGILVFSVKWEDPAFYDADFSDTEYSGTVRKIYKRRYRHDTKKPWLGGPKTKRQCTLADGWDETSAVQYSLSPSPLEIRDPVE